MKFYENKQKDAFGLSPDISCFLPRILSDRYKFILHFSADLRFWKASGENPVEERNNIHVQYSLFM